MQRFVHLGTVKEGFTNYSSPVCSYFDTYEANFSASDLF